MDKFFQRLTIAVFLLITFGVSAATIHNWGKESVSFFENRSLAKLEEFNIETYSNGEFMASAEKAFSDNMYKRDDIIRAYTAANRYILGKNCINGIVFGDGALLAYYKTNTFDKEKIDSDMNTAIERIKKFDDLVEDNGGKFIYVGIPAQFSVMNDKYPEFFCDYSPKLDYVEDKMFSAFDESGIEFINMKKIFMSRDDKDELYFSTDHHYNFFGAMAVYEEIMKKINSAGGYELKALKIDDMNLKKIENKFLGSSSRKIYDIFPNDDELIIGTSKENVPFKRYESGEETEAALFKEQNSKYSDYSVFMGGDKPETLIDTERDDLPNILIFGDSYTNPVESIIYNNFNKTYCLDFRYNKTKTAAEYIKELKPDVVVYIRDETVYTGLEDNGDFFGEEISN